MSRWALVVGVVLGSMAAGCASEEDASTGASSDEAREAARLSCQNPEPGTCTFYASCLENSIACGPNGYALGYGAKYCSRFLAEDRFSADGALWRDITLTCLQRSLIDYVDPAVASDATCEEVKDVAFDSHPVCYTQPEMSVCDLSFSDWNVIRQTVDTGDVFSGDGIRQVLSVMRRCLFGGFFSVDGGFDGVAAGAPLEGEAAAEFEQKASLLDAWQSELDARR